MFHLIALTLIDFLIACWVVLVVWLLAALAVDCWQHRNDPTIADEAEAWLAGLRG